MGDQPTEDQLRRGAKFGNFLAGFSFWMIAAPPAFLAVSRMTTIPTSFLLIAIGVPPETMEIVNPVLGWIGVATGALFTWWVWGKAKESYLGNNHAA